MPGPRRSIRPSGRLSGRPLFGLLGLGRFGTLAAQLLSRRGEVWGHDPKRPARPVPGVRLVGFEEACSARVVVMAVPMGSMQKVIGEAAWHLRQPVLVADTASVKVLPCRWMEAGFPTWAEVVGTHPLFGPDSASAGISGLKIAVCPLRLRRQRAVTRFLESLGLRVIVTDPDRHDRDMARTQAVVQFVGRALERMKARPEELDTSGYRKLLEILHYVRRDSLGLFLDMQRLNPHASGVREQLIETLQEIHQEAAPPR
jgi:prephenate dehydrogenase